MPTLTWLGHASWLLRTGRHCVLLDPFLTGNPAAAVAADEVAADFILVSHGHGDHVGDTAAIAHRTGAQVIAMYEITQWLDRHHHVKNSIGMNLGGSVELPFGRLKMTLAHHSSTLPDGSPGGNPCGFLLEVDGRRIYFACDTALFGDMQWIGRGGLDAAILPIGDLFTMGPDDSLEAIKLLRPRKVLPSHYNTWPPIAQDAAAWAARVRQETAAEPLTPSPGEAVEI
jgi:L-ascorbate metabolism protein UlaG (beta-lactamase superfamily)